MGNFIFHIYVKLPEGKSCSIPVVHRFSWSKYRPFCCCEIPIVRWSKCQVMDWGLLHLMPHKPGNFGLRPVPRLRDTGFGRGYGDLPEFTVIELVVGHTLNLSHIKLTIVYSYIMLYI